MTFEEHSDKYKKPGKARLLTGDDNMLISQPLSLRVRLYE